MQKISVTCIYEIKIYVVNVKETVLQPWEKKKEFTNLEVTTRPSTRLEYHSLWKVLNRPKLKKPARVTLVILYFETTGSIPLLVEHWSPRVFTSPVVRLVWHEIYQTMFYINFLHYFAKILKDWKYGKALKSNALSSGPCRRIWLPISIFFGF